MLNKKWLQITSIAMALPMTLLSVTYFLNKLYESGEISQNTMIFVILTIVIHLFFIMIWYAFKRKN